MATSHWTWISHEVRLEGKDAPIPLGKKNVINNFCMNVEGNWPRCTSCHAGYGWKDASFDFGAEANVDCLVCHDRSGGYVKAPAGAGYPAEGVDLLAAARSVGRPLRQNCGNCHFAGGGGDAVKHGDMDGTMVWPTERIDVHMGRHRLECVDCHRTEHHRIRGRLPSVSNDLSSEVLCTDCHAGAPHSSERLNSHVRSVACETCHVPTFAIEAATKMSWDWSTAGQDLPNADPHLYSKAKGSFTFAKQVVPEYRWHNGLVDLYVPGESIDPEGVTEISRPLGDPRDPGSRIYPFKPHRGKQAYDTRHRYLLKAKLCGPGGYWSDFDWDKALRLGAEASGLPYSGAYGFARTVMYWPIAHMVVPKTEALSCRDCHGAGGRMDWAALGFDGDPAYRGDRLQAGLTVVVPGSDGDTPPPKTTPKTEGRIGEGLK
jgi:octaheme c-type cytochrome (tetrathionate reductase family)